MSTTTTASGLQYEDTVVGEGAEAKAGAYVTVHYTGWLRNDDGVFVLQAGSSGGSGHVVPSISSERRL